MDGVALESGVPKHVLNMFFHTFTAWMVQIYFDEWVSMP